MATAYLLKETAFRFGCGRYIQEAGCLASVAEEIKRLGASRPFIMGGTTALSLTKETINASLAEAGMTAHYYTYTGFCCVEHCERIMATEAFRDADIVIGVGGGNLMDAAKYCGVKAEKPIINIPTSSATCAAFTCLSITYNGEGATAGRFDHKVEINAILADTDILCRQPARLFLAGAYDSLAKQIEIEQRLMDRDLADTDIGLLASYELSKFIHTRILEDLDGALEDLKAGQSTKRLCDMIFIQLALTGVIGGLARGSNQSALAHRIYESVRALYPREAYPYLHGELVAIGLIAQLAYNNDIPAAEAFAAQMKGYGMYTSLAQILPVDADTRRRLHEKLLVSTAMAGTTEEEHKRLFDVLAMIC